MGLAEEMLTYTIHPTAVSAALSVQRQFPKRFEETVGLLEQWIAENLRPSPNYREGGEMRSFLEKLFPERYVSKSHVVVALLRAGFEVGTLPPEHVYFKVKAVGFAPRSRRYKNTLRPDRDTADGAVLQDIVDGYFCTGYPYIRPVCSMHEEITRRGLWRHDG